MILDYLHRFCDAQAITGAGPFTSTNVIDLGPFFTGNTNRQLGMARRQLFVLCTVTEAAASAGASTITVTLNTDDNAAMSSPTAVTASAAIPKATWIVGYQLVIPIPVNAVFERYIALSTAVAVANLTTGKFTADLTDNLHYNNIGSYAVASTNGI